MRYRLRPDASDSIGPYGPLKRNSARQPLPRISLSDECPPTKLLYSPEIVLVSLDFQRLVREAVKHSEALLTLDPRQFEEFIAEIWHRFGYQVELTKRTRDGGFDVAAVGGSRATTRFLIECKRWDPEHKIGVSVVRELYAVKLHESATKAILATTSYLTSEADEFIDDHIWELEARDHEGVLRWVRDAVKTNP